MIVTFAARALAVCVLASALLKRPRACLRAVVVGALVLAGLAGVAPARVTAASGTTLFSQSLANNTVNSAYPVSVPSSPNGTNYACLTDSGNTGSGAPVSCPANNDAQGSGKLRLTAASTG